MTVPEFCHAAVRIVLIEILTGFFLSFLIEVNLGTDPCTFMNLEIARVLKLSFGTWQLVLNAVLFVVVVAVSRLRYIGVGTIANMVCIGYSSDFCRWIWRQLLPRSLFTAYPGKILFFVMGLAGFILCCAVYMNYDMGLAPYDATPCLISGYLSRVPFPVIRMCWDFGVIGIGCLFGGKPPVGTLILAIFLGPAVSLVGRFMHRDRRAVLIK